MSPQTTILPFCIIKPAMNPALPPIIREPPFMDMPALAPALPPTNTSPPRMLDATEAPASLDTTTLPLIRFSPRPHPALPLMVTSGPSMRLAA